MSDFEKDLREALQRTAPSAGFTERVLAQSRVQSYRRQRSMTGTRWIGAAIAAGLLLTAGGFEYRQYQGRKAKEQLLLALNITQSKLNIVQQKINDWNRRSSHE